MPIIKHTLFEERNEYNNKMIIRKIINNGFYFREDTNKKVVFLVVGPLRI